MTKKLMRNTMRKQLASLDEVTYNKNSKQIEDKFMKQVVASDATTIGLTISNFPEVDTWSIIKHLWSIGRKVVVPKCSPKDRSMDFYQIQSFDQLERVYMHLLEPNPQQSIAITPQDIDMLVVPGVAYSKEGYRIGFGGGYYDRYLTKFSGDTLSLAFDIQVVEDVEYDVFDIPVDQIITPNEIIRCKQNRKKDEIV